ncbi:MAG: hypothetical protein JXB49_02255 [Bacteroidales bacterium]|nr:hypothetical protein [Bacteroidales bacterium]
MYRQFRIIILFTVIIITIYGCKKDSNTISKIIMAASTSLEDVQVAVDSAESGYTVQIPEGSSTWYGTLVVPDGRRITLLGSGEETTIISSDSTTPGIIINLNNSGSRVTNIGFQLSNDNGCGIRVGGNDWRVDHCLFENPTENTIEGVIAWGTVEEDDCPTGVIDHCVFNDVRVIVVGYAGLMANKIWSEPLGLGTNNAMFVEDCEFNFIKFGNAVDANYGGRYVFRHNVVNDAYIEAHSLQGTHRATRSYEIYGNTINQVERGMWAPFFLRGGTGVVFDNIITGSWFSGPSIIVDNRRSFEALGDGGLCDGTSPWDGNELPNGYPARDQIGRSTDEWLWIDENPYPPQEFDPLYQWNNYHNGAGIDVYVHNNCDIHIRENRDYYNNTEKPGYSPYTYPHPLVRE